jgi:selenocysteine-specific elongation factor
MKASEPWPQGRSWPASWRGEEVEALPSGRRARVRGLQVHGEAVERAAAGTRTAVNLAGEVEGLARGEVLARPGTLRATSMIDAQVSLLPGARPLADGARVRVHAASAEVLARVRLLGPESLEPGRSALAQLRLESPAVVGRGDRLVLRSYSPADTIAGAVVVDPLPPRRRAADLPAVERLRDAAALLAAAEAMVAEAAESGIDAALGGSTHGAARRSARSRERLRGRSRQTPRWSSPGASALGERRSRLRGLPSGTRSRRPCRAS